MIIILNAIFYVLVTIIILIFVGVYCTIVKTHFAYMVNNIRHINMIHRLLTVKKHHKIIIHTIIFLEVNRIQPDSTVKK